MPNQDGLQFKAMGEYDEPGDLKEPEDQPQQRPAEVKEFQDERRKELAADETQGSDPETA